MPSLTVPPAAADAAAADAPSGARRRARPLARQSGLRDVSVAPPAQQARLGERDLAHRYRSRRHRSRLRRRRFLRHLSRQRSATWSRRCSPRSTRRRIFPIGDRTLREELTDGVSLSPAPDMLFELISYITGGERQAEGQAACRRQGSRTAMPRRSTCWRRCINSPASGPIRRPSSRRSIRCSRGVYSISSSLKSIPGRVSLTVDAVRYEVDKRTRLGVCSTFLGGRVDARRQDQGLCPEGAAFRAARRSVESRSS